MPTFIDLTGQRFGRLTIVNRVKNSPDRRVQWICKCTCGNTKITSTKCLRNEHTTSCGCVQRERAKLCHLTHGKSKSAEYFIWQHIKDRCTNPKNKHFKDYGGRGIKICDAWIDSFPEFYKAIGPRSTPKHTIERIDNSLGYFPKNVKWATSNEQANNKRNNRKVTFNGKTMNITQWEKKFGLSKNTLYRRIVTAGEPIEKVFSKSCHN